MAVRVQNPNPARIIQWHVKAGGVYADQLVKDDTGAAPVAAAHTGATLLGVAMETQLTTDGIVRIYPLQGTVLEIDYRPGTTKTTFEVTDLGLQYDMYVSSNVMTVDPDDTTGGYLILIGYDNDAKKGYFAVEAADCLMNI